MREETKHEQKQVKTKEGMELVPESWALNYDKFFILFPRQLYLLPVTDESWEGGWIQSSSVRERDKIRNPGEEDCLWVLSTMNREEGIKNVQTMIVLMNVMNGKFIHKWQQHSFVSNNLGSFITKHFLSVNYNNVKGKEGLV